MQSTPAEFKVMGIAMLEGNANLIPDLETYLSNNDRFKFHIHDRQEVQYIASRLGTTPNFIRSELRKLGYKLIKNRYGRIVWKKEADRHTARAKAVTGLDDYIAKCESRQMQFYDRSEVARIAHRTENKPEHVRTVLRRKGYKLIKNPHGIAVWVKGENICHFRQYLVFCCYINCCLVMSKFIGF